MVASRPVVALHVIELQGSKTISAIGFPESVAGQHAGSLADPGL
jgi:hypothetical protein